MANGIDPLSTDDLQELELTEEVAGLLPDRVKRLLKCTLEFYKCMRGDDESSDS